MLDKAHGPGRLPTKWPLEASDLALRLAAIIDSSDDAMISEGLDGTITSWNTAATRLFGYRSDEVIGQSILLIIPPELYPQELESLNRVGEGERIEDCETQRLRKGGGRIEVSMTLSPIRDLNDQVVGTSSIVRDVHQLQQLDQARTQLAAIVESSDDAIISQDRNGILTSWNSGAERMFGYSAEEIIGRSVMMLIPPELHHEEADIMRKLMSGGRLERFETQRLKKDGQRIDVSLAISPMRDMTGRITGASKIARDISDRRRVDEARVRLAAIVESSDDAIIGKDLDGVITSWNSGATRMFGYLPDEIIGHSILRLIPRELHSEEPMILARLRAGKRVEHFESRRLSKDGRVIDVSLTISPIRNADGVVIGASKIARDITSRKLAETALMEKEKLAATGRMVATLAHEVNNPLEAIMNLAFLLAKDPSLSAQGRSYAALLLGEVQRAGEITKQTLSFFRSTTTPTEVRMPVLLDSIVVSKKGRVDKKQIEIRNEIKGRGLAWGFPGELGQVFSNLIENAIDAVEECGQVRIRTRDLNTKPGDLCVSICDNGCGMTSQTLECIFEPFFTTKAQRGSGLGLWVTRGIIAKHGGTLRVRTSQSPKRHGTIFSVTLPAGIPTRPRTVADAPVAA